MKKNLLIGIFLLSCFSVLGCYLGIGTYRAMHPDIKEAEMFKILWPYYLVEVICLLFVIFIGKRKDLL